MKITKIDSNDEGTLIVWTDAIENMGFNFNVDEILDKYDLKEQLKLRVKEYLKSEAKTITRKDKVKWLKELEGKDFD